MTENEFKERTIFMFEVQEFLSSINEENYLVKITGFRDKLFKYLSQTKILKSFLISMLHFLRLRSGNYRVYANVIRDMIIQEEIAKIPLHIPETLLKLTFSFSYKLFTNVNSVFLKKITNFILILHLLEIGVITKKELVESIRSFYYSCSSNTFFHAYVFSFFFKDIQEIDKKLFKDLEECFLPLQTVHLDLPKWFPKPLLNKVVANYNELSHERQKTLNSILELEHVDPIYNAIVTDNFEEFSKLAYDTENRETLFDLNTRIQPCLFEPSEVLHSAPSLIQLAAFYSASKIFKHLLLSEASLAPTSRDGKTIDHFAIAGGNLEIVRILTQYDIEFNEKSLKTAIKYHRNDIVHWFFEFYSDQFNQQNSLSLAIRYDNLEILNDILQNCENLESNDIKIDLLHCSLPETVSLLFDFYSQKTSNINFPSLVPDFIINEKIDFFDYALDTKKITSCSEDLISSSCLYLHCFKRICEEGLIDIRTTVLRDAPIPFQMTSLKQFEVFQSFVYMLDQWPEVVHLINEERTHSLLASATEAGNPMMVLELVKRGADINFVCQDTLKQPIHIAAEFSIKCVEILVSAGADINAINKENGRTPIFYAVKKMPFYDVKRMIDLGAKIDVIDKNGESLLSYACRESLPQIFFYLFEMSNMKNSIEIVDCIKKYDIFRFIVEQSIYYPNFVSKIFNNSVLENIINEGKIQELCLLLSIDGNPFTLNSVQRNALFNGLREKYHSYIEELFL